MNKRTIAHVGMADKKRIAETRAGAFGEPFVKRNATSGSVPGGAARGYVAGGRSKHRQRRQSSLRSKSHFGGRGQIGGQVGQQARVCDSAAALTGWFPP